MSIHPTTGVLTIDTGVAALYTPNAVATTSDGTDTEAFSVDVQVTNAAGNPRPVTLTPPAATLVVQAMTTGVEAAVTTTGSVFDVAMIIVEDNMQASIPDTINIPSGGTAHMSLAATGVYTYTLTGNDGTFDIPVTYYSPATKQMSFATITTVPPP